jgi:ketosteroid isomerase-like protein
MSQENVEIVRAGYDAFNRGDMEAIVATLDPAIEWWPAADEPIVEPYRGHDGYRALVGEIREYVPDLQAEIQESFAAGDHVVTCLRFWGRGRDSGAPSRFARRTSLASATARSSRSASTARRPRPSRPWG